MIIPLQAGAEEVHTWGSIFCFKHCLCLWDFRLPFGSFSIMGCLQFGSSSRKNLGPEKDLSSGKNSGPKKNLGPKEIWVQKKFGSRRK